MGPWAVRSHIFLAAILVSVLFAGSLNAQSPALEEAVLSGITTTSGGIRLAGVAIVLRGASGQEPLVIDSNDLGEFELRAPPGTYTLTALLEGFRTIQQPVVLEPGQTTTLSLDLTLAGVNETVEVVATAQPEPPTTAAREIITSRFIEEAPIGRTVAAALDLIPGVISGPAGLSARGGHFTQAGLQLESATFVDPATGNGPLTIPVEAISSIEVLPNPYTVEFGRFSTALTLLKARRGTDRWLARVNGILPSLRQHRDNPFKIVGIAGYSPGLSLGGPLIKDRLFMHTGGQITYATSELFSRPQSERRERRSLNAFTRLDFKPTAIRTMTATINVAPERRSNVRINTFNPPALSVESRGHIVNLGLKDMSPLGATLLESTIEVSEYQRREMPYGTQAMELWPEENQGSFYNAHQRRAVSVQWVESLARSIEAGGGTHLIKAGFDLLHSRFDGWSESRPVLVRRSDGTLARSIVFGGRTEQRLVDTSVAAYVQDRWQHGLLTFDLGIRFDRDGVTATSNVSPRFGATLKVGPQVRFGGGGGVFYERTPSMVGTFRQFEGRTETRYAADGVTVVGGPLHFSHVVPGRLEAPRSTAWDFNVDYQPHPRVWLRGDYVARRGQHEPVLRPIASGAEPAIELRSDGRSSYRAASISARVVANDRFEFNASYVRASAKSDLNRYTNFFGADRDPLIGENAYATATEDVPHRVLARGRLQLSLRWLVVPVFEARSGAPFSAVDENRDFILPRNNRRFPGIRTFHLSIERRIRFFKLEPWIALRIRNMFQGAAYADVQNNAASERFGRFFDRAPRQIGLNIRVR